MYVVHTNSMGATFQPKLTTGNQVLQYGISSNLIDGDLIASWKPAKMDGSDGGYDTQRKCFAWGRRPADAVLFGVHGLGAPWSGGGEFRICPPGTCPTPPPARPCPPCALPPSSPADGGLVPPTIGYDDGVLGKYGVQIGLLAAAVLTGGVGYYGYKKGWFKRKKR